MSVITPTTPQPTVIVNWYGTRKHFAGPTTPRETVLGLEYRPLCGNPSRGTTVDDHRRVRSRNKWGKPLDYDALPLCKHCVKTYLKELSA